MSGTTNVIGTGPGAWFDHLGSSIAGMRHAYMAALRKQRTRTLVLTVIIVVGLVYPVLNQYFLEGFSRNVFPLPLPDATVMTFMTIFGIMAVGLNIVVGFAGLLDLGYVAFYAIGAYMAAFLSSPHWHALGLNLTFLGNVPPGAQGIHLPFWIIVPIAILVVATFGALLGAPTLRLRGDYLAIVTLGFGEIVPLVFKNLSSLTLDFSLGPINVALNNVNLTGGVQGINPIDPPFLPFLNILFDSRSGPLAVYLGILLLAVTVLIARNLEHSRIGRAWMAIREDETAAEMMGVNTVRTKLLAFALGASAAGIAGAFQAAYLGATTSDFFEFSTSILVLIMIILGGIGNIWGVIVGAIMLVYVNATLLPYLGQRVQESAPWLPNPAQYNFLLYGIILLVMMRFRPQGFLPNRQRVAELNVVAVEEAEAEMVEAAAEAESETETVHELEPPLDLDNVSVAPPGQDATGPDARAPEVPGEGRDL
jgi:branched-chain amino acid transport system permease protein